MQRTRYTQIGGTGMGSIQLLQSIVLESGYQGENCKIIVWDDERYYKSQV